MEPAMTEKSEKESPWLMIPLTIGFALVPFALMILVILVAWWIG